MKKSLQGEKNEKAHHNTNRQGGIHAIHRCATILLEHMELASRRIALRISGKWLWERGNGLRRYCEPLAILAETCLASAKTTYSHASVER